MVGRSTRKIALLVETSTTYGRKILEGIAQYQSSHERWSVYLDERELRATPPNWLFNRPWDGMICRTTDRELARSIKRRKIQAVDLNDLYTDLGLPSIRSDMESIGRIGAIHLLERGFRNFAYCGFKEETWSQLRCSGFKKEIEHHGFQCSVFESAWRGNQAPMWDQDQEKISNWISSLPKPLGIMACNDVRGQHVLNVCQDLECYVPEQVAVVGVDNDELLCNFCNPPLSSIQPNPMKIGYEAAKMLDALIDGKSPPSFTTLVDPIGVVTRQSSDALGIADADVVAAIAYIRENAFFGITVSDIVDHVSVSRSHLERAFRNYLGHSPQVEIRTTQIKRAKELLIDSDLALNTIARLVGFEHTEYMTVVFKRLTNQSPSDFRKQIRTFQKR